MKVCFWSTSFQADNLALATSLAESEGVEVWVAMDDPSRFAGEPVHALLPFEGRLLDRRERRTMKLIEAWQPDVLVVDNHLPPRRLAERIFVCWHGLGWRVDDVAGMRAQLHKWVGDTGAPNPNFRWQAFGEPDRQYRIEHSGFSPDNVVALGSAYSDLLRQDGALRRDFAVEAVQEHYTIDLARPTVLLGLTWHHGGALGHWGDDVALHEQLVAHVGRAGGNVLIRMHDRHRYEREVVRATEALAARHAHVELKFKSEYPDSLVDILVSAAMISNYSSFLNAYYYTGRPSIHIDPRVDGAQVGVYRRLDKGLLGTRVKTETIAEPAALWKLSPDDVGGLVARSFDELLRGIDRSLAEPDCCLELASGFADRHITAPDGSTCARMLTYLRGWAR